MADTIKSFLVSYGFDLDSSSQRRVEEAVAKTEKKNTATTQNESGKRDKIDKDEVERREKRRQESEKKQREQRDRTLKDLQSFSLKASAFAIKAVTAVEATALGVVYAVDKAAQSFERLNYLSQRAGASSKSVTAFGYASSQLGSNAGTADAELGAFGQKLKTYPGYRDALARLIGPVTNKDGSLQDTGGLATRLGAKLDEIRRRGGATGQAQAQAQGRVFGFEDYQQLQAMMNPKFAGIEAQRSAQMGKLGADPDAAAKGATAFEQSMRGLQSVITDIGTKIETGLFTKLQPQLDALADWGRDHGQQIADIIGKIVDVIISMAKGFADVAAKLTGESGLTAAFTALGVVLGLKVLAPLTSIVGLLTRLGSMAMPGWLLSTLGVTGAAALGLAANSVATGTPTTMSGLTDKAAGLDDENIKAARSGDYRSWFGRHVKPHLPGWLGGNSAGSGHARLGRQLGMGGVTTSDKTLPPEARALLDTIASGEAKDYNVVNGGSTFSDFSHHPYNGLPTTRGGRASGRYQFLPTTWAGIQRETGISDFSPGSQDKGAWYLAQRNYKQRTGRDLGTGLKDPSKLSGIGEALRPTWVSLGGSFAGKYRGNLQRPEAVAVSAAPKPIPNINALAAGLTKQTLSRPLGDSISHVRGDTNIAYNPSFTINGHDTFAAMHAARMTASRGQQDLLRNVQGMEQ